MARGGVPTKAPNFRSIDWAAEVRRAWGDDWMRKDTAYEFSNGRKFDDPGRFGGAYLGTGTGV